VSLCVIKNPRARDNNNIIIIIIITLIVCDAA
jgi:hypothetical protein